MAYAKGDEVEWDWASGTATGTIDASHETPITRTIKGSEITRNGSKEDPALEITHEDGAAVIKLASEVRIA